MTVSSKTKIHNLLETNTITLPILVVAATEMELAGLPAQFADDVRFFASGAGVPVTVMRLTELLAREQFRLVINIGIAGSYAMDVPVGSVFRITEDSFADLGIETEQGFVPLREFPFCPPEVSSLNEGGSASVELNLPTAIGHTFNTVHGSVESIARLNISEGLETMEGAAVQMVCRHFGIPHVQIRAVSNYVEPRDPSRWNIPLAIQNLEAVTAKLIRQLIGEK